MKRMLALVCLVAISGGCTAMFSPSPAVSRRPAAQGRPATPQQLAQASPGRPDPFAQPGRLHQPGQRRPAEAAPLAVGDVERLPPVVAEETQAGQPGENTAHPNSRPDAYAQSDKNSPADENAPADDSTWKAIVAEMATFESLTPEYRQRVLADLRQADRAIWPAIMRDVRAHALRQTPLDDMQLAAVDSTRGQLDYDGPARGQLDYDGPARGPSPPAPMRPLAADETSSQPRVLTVSQTDVAQAEGESPEMADLPAHASDNGTGGDGSSTDEQAGENELAEASADEDLASSLAARAGGPLSPPEPDDEIPTGEEPVSLLDRSQHARPASLLDRSQQARPIEQPGDAIPLESVSDPQGPSQENSHEPGSGQIVPATHEAPLAGIGRAAAADWQSQLAAAIAALDAELQANPDDESLAAQLRLLRLASGEEAESLAAIPAASPEEETYWSAQLGALEAWMDAGHVPDSRRRATSAAALLHQAAAAMGQQGQLLVRNLTFCTKVASYGVYIESAAERFRPGQQVLIYAEIENFKSVAGDKGHRTSLRTKYRIVDGDGSQVAEHDFPPAEDFCNNPRRDFFVRYFLTLPENLAEGQYTLSLHVEDALNQSAGEAAVEFAVASEK